jgi:hypothetical protein
MRWLPLFLALLFLPSTARADLVVNLNSTLTTTYTPAVGAPTVLVGDLGFFFPGSPPPPPPETFFNLQGTNPDGTVVTATGAISGFLPFLPQLLAFEPVWNWGFQGTASGSSLVSLAGQLGYSFTGTAPFTEEIRINWFVNGTPSISIDQFWDVPVGHTVTGTIPQILPDGVSGLRQAQLVESVGFLQLPPMFVPETPTALLFVLGGALLAGWFWRKWF